MSWSISCIQYRQGPKGDAKTLRSVAGVVPGYGHAPRHAWLAINLGSFDGRGMRGRCAKVRIFFASIVTA